MNSSQTKILLLCFAVVSLVFLLMIIGPVNIPINELFGESHTSEWQTILWEIRFPKTLTALLAGVALGLTGLIMQTYFNNPLADPYILGVQSGASLGVAIGIMALDSVLIVFPNYLGQLSTIFFATVGSLLTLFFLMTLSKILTNKLILLVMGLVFGHVITGIISILVTISESHKIKNFLLWTMGSFQRVQCDQIGIFVVIILIGSMFLFCLSSRLNLLLLGDKYARSSGLNVLKTRKMLLLITAILSGTVTSFCGPIAFIGIISPHLARSLLKTSNHFVLIPSVALLGAIMALASEFISSFMGDMTLPVNGILGLVGGPIIFIILINYKKVYHS